MVLVETVGVGQSESEVADLVDTLAFVTQPGAGDLLQFMKAGVLELPDVFVVNKADQGALRRAHGARARGAASASASAPARADAARWCSSRRATAAASTSCSRRSTPTARVSPAQRWPSAGAAGATASSPRRSRARYGTHGLAALGGTDALAKRIDAEPARLRLRARRAPGRRDRGGAAPMKRGLRIVLLALLAALLAGFIAGTVIRLRFERPVQYLGSKKGSDPFLNGHQDRRRELTRRLRGV